MNLANWLSLNNVEFGLAVIEGTLVLGFLILFLLVRRSRTGKTSGQETGLGIEALRALAGECENLCQSLSKNLDDKREIARRLNEQFDQKIVQLQVLIGQAGEKEKPLTPPSKEKDLDEQILEMVGAGVDLNEIGRRLNLTRGEVQLILDLKRYGK